MPARRALPTFRRAVGAAPVVVCLLGLAATSALADGPSPLVVTGGDTPYLRLHQDTSNPDPFPAQMWDLAGNETNVFLRDATHNNTIPFRVGAGAPTNSLIVEPNGNVGVGAKLTTSSPPAAVPTPSSLYVYRSDGSARLTVEEGSPTEAQRVLGMLQNDGPALLQFNDVGADPMTWFVGNGDGHDFALRASSTATTTLTVSPTGTTRSAGALEQRTDGLTDVAPIAPSTMLSRIRALPGFSTWRYAADPDRTPHLGLAADVQSALGVGPSGNIVNPADLAVAALAGVRALADVPPGSDPRVTPLVTSVASLKTQSASNLRRIKVLEHTTKKLTSSNKKLMKSLATLQKQVRALRKRR